MTTGRTSTDKGGHHWTQREEARRWVRRKRTFNIVLVVYVALVALWFLIDVLTGWDDWWFYWPTLGAGIIVLVIGLSMCSVLAACSVQVGSSGRWIDIWNSTEVRTTVRPASRRNYRRDSSRDKHPQLASRERHILERAVHSIS
jgi:2TM domain